MKSIFATLTLLLSAQAFAKDTHLVCITGDIGDMDIKIEEQMNGKEKLSVILTGMDGETVRTYVNSNFSNHALTRGLKDGRIQAIVSKSDLQASFGGAFLEAGVLEMHRNPKTQKQDVIFAAESLVYAAECIEK